MLFENIDSHGYIKSIASIRMVGCSLRIAGARQSKLSIIFIN